MHSLSQQIGAANVNNNNLPPVREMLTESGSAITPGACNRLIVPREDLKNDLDDGVEMDLVALQGIKIRKPQKNEWFFLNRDSELTTRLVLHQPKSTSFDPDYYFVDRELRGPLLDYLADVRVFVYRSMKTKALGLWAIKMTPGNHWYEQQAALLKQPSEFFQTRAIRIYSDRGRTRYICRHKLAENDAPWPPRTNNDLLGEALGERGFIRSTDHEIYQELTEGEELTNERGM